MDISTKFRLKKKKIFFFGGGDFEIYKGKHIHVLIFIFIAFLGKNPFKKVVITFSSTIGSLNLLVLGKPIKN